MAESFIDIMRSNRYLKNKMQLNLIRVEFKSHELSKVT